MLRQLPRLLVALAALFAMLQPAQGAAGDLRYVIDRSASHVDAKVPFFGIASKTAKFPDMSGTFNLSFANLEALDMVVDIDARTLTTGDSQTKTLKGKSFFDVARHPTVRFVGRHIKMTGDTPRALVSLALVPGWGSPGAVRRMARNLKPNPLEI